MIKAKGAYQALLSFFGMGDLPAQPASVVGRMALEEGFEGNPFTPPGRLRYWAVASNNFYDNKGLEFPSWAQQDYVDWVWTKPGERMSELQIWHTPGTRLGQDDWVDFDGHFLHSTGLIDVGREELARRYAQDPDIAMSHGYIVVWDEHRRASVFRSYEKSVLPREHAGNSLTSFGLEEDSMAFTPARKKFLQEAGYSDADITSREARWEAFGKFCEDAGIGFHELTMYSASLVAEAEANGTTPPAPPVPVVGQQNAAPPVAAAANPLPTDILTAESLRELIVSVIDEKLTPLTTSVHALQGVNMSADERAAQEWTTRLRAGSSAFRASTDPATTPAAVAGQQAIATAQSADPKVAAALAQGIHAGDPLDPNANPTDWIVKRLQGSNGAFAALSPNGQAR